MRELSHHTCTYVFFDGMLLDPSEPKSAIFYQFPVSRDFLPFSKHLENCMKEKGAIHSNEVHKSFEL